MLVSGDCKMIYGAKCFYFAVYVISLATQVLKQLD